MHREALIDLRSDTVTRPNERMRAAMAAAETGDDVYGEDPTVNRLEERAAELLGKEAGLFVPTGTMGNTIALTLHTKHGEEVVCDSRSHIIDWELSMMAWFAGCIPRAIATDDGILSWRAIEAILRSGGPNNAPTTLIALENTHNMGGGTVYPRAVLEEIALEAHRRGLKVHMDGARIFNAAEASGQPVADMAQFADTVMFCLSKGLGAPVGSLLVGTAEDLKRGRLLRKRLGGGMRQAGVLAAAGLIALEESPAQLALDHANAQLIATRLRVKAETNIVIFDISKTGLSTQQFSDALKGRGILASGIDRTHMRVVTHCDVTAEQCFSAADAIHELCTTSCSTT